MITADTVDAFMSQVLKVKFAADLKAIARGDFATGASCELRRAVIARAKGLLAEVGL